MPDFESATISKEAVQERQVIKESAKSAKPAKVQEQAATLEKEKPEYSKEELMVILDTIIFEGEYSEKISIRSKLNVTFRTRTAEETLEVSKNLDNKQYNLATTYQEERTMYNLAYSLTNYNGADLLKAKPVPERLNYISKLPIFVVSALADALARFDKKVDTACREIENF